MRKIYKGTCLKSNDGQDETQHTLAFVVCEVAVAGFHRGRDKLFSLKQTKYIIYGSSHINIKKSDVTIAQHNTS